MRKPHWAESFLGEWTLALVMALGIAAGPSLWAADKDDPKADKTAKDAKDAKDSKDSKDPKEEKSAGQAMELKTKDNVTIHCTWYPGAGGKDVIPILMLHGFGGQRTDFDDLAAMLNERGYAVLVPDLRGHGESTKRKVPGQDEETLKRESFKQADVVDMGRQDLEAIRRFFIERNNAGEINYNSLGIVAVEAGCVLAAHFSAEDWARTDLPNQQVGKNIKALVLVSPSRDYKGLPIGKALSQPGPKDRISMMILSGKKDIKAAAETQAAFAAVRNFHQHSELPYKTLEERIKTQDLYRIDYDTTLQGIKLLTEPKVPPAKILPTSEPAPVTTALAGFLAARLQKKQPDNPWSSRLMPQD